MGWFDEQIRQRTKSDQEVFEDSIFNMASSVIGVKAVKDITDSRVVTKAAIEEIIKYFGYKPETDSFNQLGEDIDLANILRPFGIMFREVTLDEEWTKEAYGPMIGKLRSDGTVIALLPGKSKGYYYQDYKLGKRVNVSRKVLEDIDPQAICFYKPLPTKKLGIRDLIIYMKNCLDIPDFIGYVILMSIVTIIGIMATSLVEIVSGYVVSMHSYPMLFGTAIFLFSLGISEFMIEASAELIMERIELKTGINVEAAVMNRVLNLPAGFFRKYTSGELAARINSVKELCELIIGNAVTMPLVLVLSLAYLFEIRSFAPALVLPALAINVISLIFSLITIFIQTGITQKVMQYDAEEDGITYAFINGIQKIKLAGAEKRAFAKWANSFNESANLLYSPPTVIKLNKTINMAIGLVGTLIIYAIAVKTNVNESEYMAFNTAYGLLGGAFASISSVALQTANIRPILKLAEPILTEIPESSEGKAVINRVNGNIELSNVRFKYDENGPEILRGVSTRIKAGEYVAIVGKTGCGKSTLLRLLLGFEVPTKGAIYYDGRDITKIDMTSLRRKIGTVTQNGSLFQGDIYSNIVITNPLLTVDDAWEAAEIAGIADDIRQMPMGMNTFVSEGQGGISGGQKQRIMIARAVAPKPKILMLDEATSALDNITQKKVSESLDKLKCTRIVIAHRLSTIKNCDRILVIDDGKIVEEGRYEELMEKEGYFAELVKRQQL
ncbi:bacteriocin ABC transporter ATP-binding/permease protein [Butyrivibrio proteoclasticus B316]|uniref:Bacteriocin ABC transporter ATP-binding/permease protein n=1 Tax=Butyrivibrio proteoclasticus (strain ATCC 51982 / DSM 14932 / B316) TaxID=515622 RepID=E0S172_BUTPB|nr:ATP-binding cassette domain-containing protein [Butyrivibrio proteoclasticus]ADL33547.1 bacteriocin ABC transporter ATP-binding/permease protein [Butyrivibrio proteoclasticus B316]